MPTVELHLKLGIVIPEQATSHPRALFNDIKLVVRCQKRNDLTSLPTRHEAGYYRLVYYKETSEVISTGTTQASQSLGLPVTATPDPGSSEETKNPPDTKSTTDGSLALYVFLIAAAVFIILARWLCISMLSIYRRSQTLLINFRAVLFT